MACYVWCLLALFATCAVSQTCDITGTWETTYTVSDLNTTTESSETIDFNTNGTYVMSEDVTYSFDGLTCTYTVSATGTYSLTSDDVLTTITDECAFVGCDPDTTCGMACKISCNFWGDSMGEGWGSRNSTVGNSTVALVFTSDCDSFTDGEGDIIFTKEGSNPWVWLVLGAAALASAGCLVAVVAAVGAIMWKKRRQAVPEFEY